MLAHLKKELPPVPRLPTQPPFPFLFSRPRTMSGLFSSYEEDYKDSMRHLASLMKAAAETIDKQKAHEADPSVDYYPPPTTGPGSRSQLLQDALQTFAHAKDLITSMNYEVNDMTDATQRGEAKTLVDGYRKTIVALDRDMSALRQAVTQAERKDLLSFTKGPGEDAVPSGVLSEVDESTKAHRLTALQTSEKMQGGTKTLLKAERYLAQTNAMGRESLGTLQQQTEQIQHIHDVTHDVDGEVSASRHVLHQMQRTALKHKLWLWGIIIALFLFLCLMLYLR